MRSTALFTSNMRIDNAAPVSTCLLMGIKKSSNDSIYLLIDSFVSFILCLMSEDIALVFGVRAWFSNVIAMTRCSAMRTSSSFFIETRVDSLALAYAVGLK